MWSYSVMGCLEVKNIILLDCQFSLVVGVILKEKKKSDSNKRSPLINSSIDIDYIDVYI